MDVFQAEEFSDFWLLKTPQWRD